MDESVTNALDESQEPGSLSELMTLLGNDSENDYPGEVSDAEITELEDVLGTTLSPGYIEFLKKFGGGNFKNFRLYTIATEDENFYDLMEQIIICNNRIPLVRAGELLPFADDYESNIFCFDLKPSKGGEYEIVKWDHDFSEEDEAQYVAYSFAEFLVIMNSSNFSTI